MRPMSMTLTRWFIVVDRAKKRKSLARPRSQVSAGTDSHLGGNDRHLAKDVVNRPSGEPVQTDMQDRVTISKQVH
jgi:hypothetical protein